MDVWIKKIEQYKTMSNNLRTIMFIKILFNGKWGAAWAGDLEIEDEYLRYSKIVKISLWWR